MSNGVTTTDFTLDGHAGRLVGTSWTPRNPRWIAVIAHDYGEHVGRFRWTAARLHEAGAAVHAADHEGHGRSDGARALIRDAEAAVEDLDRVIDHAVAENPGLPVVLIGVSMGGMLSARCTQRFGARLTALVLLSPVLGRWETIEELLPLPEIPETPIDPKLLSRDPEVAAAYAADPLVWHGGFARPTLQALRDELQRISIAGRLGRVPVLHLHGEDDRLVPVEDAVAGLAKIAGPATESQLYPGARHELLHETNRAEVMADLLAFLGRFVPVGTGGTGEAD
ncbi:alpha/beta fold hydrolase [Brachybacterium hainanense]|uniref:Alpha/beta fold hydrolase n=1 Tax=Brachybacterium hainanense TaxID=1541174 RepID=A0ABV6R8J0_9MICO